MKLERTARAPIGWFGNYWAAYGWGSRSGSDLRWGLKLEPWGNWAYSARGKGAPRENQEQQLERKAGTVNGA